MSININNSIDTEITTIIKQKRGRKPKNKVIENTILETNGSDDNDNEESVIVDISVLYL